MNKAPILINIYKFIAIISLNLFCNSVLGQSTINELLSSTIEATPKTYDITNLNVKNYFDLSSNPEFQSELKAKIFVQTKEYKLMLDSLKRKKNNIYNYTHYIKDNQSAIGKYILSCKCFTMPTNNSVSTQSYLRSLNYPSGKNILFLETGNIQNGNLVYVHNQVAVEINPLPIKKTNNLEYLLIPTDEKTALEIENSNGLSIYYFFNIKSYKVNPYSFTTTVLMYSEKSSYKNRLFVADDVRLVISDNETGKIYYDKSYTTGKPFQLKKVSDIVPHRLTQPEANEGTQKNDDPQNGQPLTLNTSASSQPFSPTVKILSSKKYSHGTHFLGRIQISKERQVPVLIAVEKIGDFNLAELNRRLSYITWNEDNNNIYYDIADQPMGIGKSEFNRVKMITATMSVDKRSLSREKTIHIHLDDSANKNILTTELPTKPLSQQLNVNDHFSPAKKADIEGFFFPRGNLNRSSYYNVDDGGDKSSLNRGILYRNKDSPLEMYIIDYKKSGNNFINGTLQLVTFEENQVYVVRKYNIDNEYNVDEESAITYYDNKNILLKIPDSQTGTASWSTVELDGTINKNESSYMVYKYYRKLLDGSFSDNAIPTLGIQVKTVQTNVNANTSTTIISNYLYGVGYYNSQIYNKTEQKFKDFEIWDNTIYDARLK